MKRISYAALVMTACFCKTGLLQAAESVDEQLAVCKSMSNFAHSVMAARQSGATASELMDFPQPAGPAALSGLARTIILGAFTLPRHPTEAEQSQAAVDFENDVYLECASAVLDL